MMLPTRKRVASSVCVSGQNIRTSCPAGHDFRNSRNHARHRSHGRRTLPAPPVGSPNPCRRPELPERWRRHRDALSKLRERIGRDPHPLPRIGEGLCPTRAAGAPVGPQKTYPDRGGSSDRDPRSSGMPQKLTKFLNATPLMQGQAN